MTPDRPPLRLRHLALNVRELEACERFYCDTLGLRVVWRPDDDNVYLSGGSDDLALHRVRGERAPEQSLDHLGFALEDAAAVDVWHEHLAAEGVPIVAPPRTHRDGARSFYCRDPEGNTVQILHDPAMRAGPGS